MFDNIDAHGVTVCALFLLVFIRITLASKDSWPFSAYPMFYKPIQLWEPRYYRLKLENNGGDRHWWAPKVKRHQRRIGVLLERHSTVNKLTLDSKLSASQQQVLIAAKQLICSEQPHVQLQALCVYERRVKRSDNKDYQIIDVLVHRVEIEQLHSGSY